MMCGGREGGKWRWWDVRTKVFLGGAWREKEGGNGIKLVYLLLLLQVACCCKYHTERFPKRTVSTSYSQLPGRRGIFTSFSHHPFSVLTRFHRLG